MGTHSKHCEYHKHLDEPADATASKKPRIVVTINLKDLTVSEKILDQVQDLPDNEDTSVHVGCKKPKAVTRFYERSAGVMCLVRPCGIILHHAEMLTCESASQLFVQLLRLQCDTGAKLKYVGYDRACEFHPFLKNLSKKGNVGASLLLNSTQFLVDKFHIKGHTTPACDVLKPECLYHPDLDKFKEIHGVNTECAEQCFAWLGKFKHCIKYMSQYKFKFFLQHVIASRNRRLEGKLTLL